MEKRDSELTEMVMKDNTRILISYLAQIAYANPSAYPLDEIFDTKFGGGSLEFSTIKDKFTYFNIEYERDTVITLQELKDVLQTKFSGQKNEDFVVDTQALVQEIKL